MKHYIILSAALVTALLTFTACDDLLHPEEDFRMCIDRDRFGFVLRMEKDSEGYIARKLDIGGKH